MNNELMSNEARDIFARINETDDLAEMLQIIKKIKALKAALDSVGLFHEKAVLYAQLEARALLRVVELGGICKLGGWMKNMAQWLYDLSEEEREQYIAKCAEGLTIRQVYKREVLMPEGLERSLRYADELRENVIRELKENGAADFKKYTDKIHFQFHDKEQLANDIINGTRIKLRQAGGISTGEDEMIYIRRDSEDSDGVIKAIKLRLDSIRRDYESLMDIVNVSGVRLSKEELLKISGWNHHNDEAAPYLLSACAAYGIIDN